MTTSDHKKVFKQLKVKPVKLKKYIKHNSPKERCFGKKSKVCKLCGRHSAHISKYDLNICRTCFRETATKIGFKKYN
jgi:ribosomal protein S14